MSDLRSSYIANCIFNIFLSHTAILLSLGPYTWYKEHRCCQRLWKRCCCVLLYLNLVLFFFFALPIFTSVMTRLLKQKNPSCTYCRIINSIGIFCSQATFAGVVAISVDRLLAVHLHLRYQELVTHKRVVAMVISPWMFSALVSLVTLWGSLSAQVIILSTGGAVLILLTTFVYIRIYFIVQRYKNQIQTLQRLHEVANFTSFLKSVIGVLYQCISDVSSMLFSLLDLRDRHWDQRPKYCHEEVSSLCSNSCISQLITEPFNLLLENDTNSARYHGHSTEHIMG